MPRIVVERSAAALPGSFPCPHLRHAVFESDVAVMPALPEFPVLDAGYACIGLTGLEPDTESEVLLYISCEREVNWVVVEVRTLE